MGRLQADGMASMLPRQQALEWHLRGNHYPPISLVFVPVAEEAIDRANEGDWDSIIEMPNGKSLSVSKIIEGLHLESFLEEKDNEST